jgi:predicted nucleotidyltransferase
VANVEANPLRELVRAHREDIMAIVARHRGRSVAIFGSVARGDEGPDSDIDFLVELAPGPAVADIARPTVTVAVARDPARRV